MSFVSTFDIFSYRFGFQHKGKTEFKSAIGGVLSFSIIIWLVVALFLFSGNFLYRKNPRITIKDDTIDKAAGIDLSQNTVILAFIIEGLTSKDLFPNNLFKMETTYYDDYTNIRTTIVDNTFELVSCRSLSGYIQEDIVKKNIELYVNGVCLKFPPGKKYDLKNSLINVSFYCFNSKDGNCLYDETFKTKVLDKTVSVFYLGLNVDIDQPENFFNNKLESFQMIINPLLSTKAELFYQFTKVESDLGIVSESLNEKTTISATSYTFNNVFNYKLNFSQKEYRETIKLFNLDVYFKNDRKTFRRFYYKLQNLFADLGGIINISLIFGKLLVYMYNKRSFELDLLNDLFSVEDVSKLNILNLNNNPIKKIEKINQGKDLTKKLNSQDLSKHNFFI